MKKSITTFAALATGLTVAASLFAATFNVEWAGALRKVHGGDTSGTLALSQIKNSQHLYAVGPVADLDGEITIIDGKFNISRVRHNSIANDGDLATQASFLVWSHVQDWGQAVDLAASINDIADLDKQIESLAVKSGVDVSKPFPFLMEGKFAKLKYHVLAPKKSNDEAGHSGGHSGGHTDNAKNITLNDAQLKIVGFYSKNHEGMFTHKGSATHLHAVEANGNSGHVDELVADSAIKVSFPR